LVESTSLKGGNDQIKWWVEVRVVIKPPDGPCKTYGRVNGFRVSYVLKDPADTVSIVCVLFQDVFQVPYL